MYRKPVSLMLALLLVFSCLPAFAEGVSTVDMKGREIALPAPAARVLAVSAAECEILYALGAGDTLVGRDEYCNYPEAVQSLPVVSSGAGLNVEQIVALHPDVVIMSTMSQTVEQVESLERAGITVAVTEATGIDGVYQSIALIGAVTGRDEEADALITRMRDAFDAITGQAKASGKTVYFEISPLEWGLWTAGSGTFMNEIAAICGLTNAFADVEGWAPISQEQVIERNPDYIITVTPAFEGGVSPIDEIKSRAGWENLTAVQNDGILCADNDSITLPGPRLVDAAQAIFDFITKE